jgi:uracil-DNA glycosylase
VGVSAPLPHPVTGEPFASPVPPGTGWPDDLADGATPVAHDADDVARLAAAATSPADLDAASSVCRACPRLVRWREDVAVAKRRAFADQPYWGRPAPGFGDPRPTLLVVGLAPAAHGANRTGWANQPTSEHAGDGLALDGARIVAAVRCAPPDNAPTPAERRGCAPWLAREVELLAPTLTHVLALGGIAWQATFTTLVAMGFQVPRPRPRFGHGARATVRDPGGREVDVVGSYHVSQQNTFTGRLTEEMLDAVLSSCRGRGHRDNEGSTP